MGEICILNPGQVAAGKAPWFKDQAVIVTCSGRAGVFDDLGTDDGDDRGRPDMEFDSPVDVLDLLFDDACGLLKDDYIRMDAGIHKHGFFELNPTEQITGTHNINFVSQVAF